MMTADRALARLSELGLSADTTAAFLHGNAARVFRL
jgi:predicted TIM-barrel fold metal-dependent hydrolase